jgi:hypothetical protein
MEPIPWAEDEKAFSKRPSAECGKDGEKLAMGDAMKGC